MLHAAVDWQGTCPLSRWTYDWYGAGGERRRFAARCLLTPLLWTYVRRCSNAAVDVTGARCPVVPRRHRGLLLRSSYIRQELSASRLLSSNYASLSSGLDVFRSASAS